MLTYYLSAINILAFALMGIDKAKARRNKWRIPEKCIFLAVALGGSIGAITGMFLFRHKTEHLSFVIGLPVILLFHLAAALWLIF